ncbi:hypothetical protein LTR78_006010 [Recurvomyces mirabilis]|uniref:Xylanolytic transcriptional activator regulatory domain-containing protein n=2 Tax=Recurvomyces mirabilis TaxID=574656 RepID=A0AAE0WLY2_9PEZI|nr:hypothetical protein LTR78_006010 [Recurvomyces mirabilis]
MHGSTQEWLNDAWLSSVGEPFGYLPGDAGPMLTPRTTTYSRTGTSFSQAAGRHDSGSLSRSQSSVGDMNVKYPVLRPVMPYVGRIISAGLACDLLDSFLANIDDGIYVPSSPLLVTHIFRRDSLLSPSKPRPCTPALLASMLLISAHTTESPFFGQSPAARMQLYQRLLQLTLDLLEGSSEPVDPSRDRAQGLATRLYRSQPNVIIHPDASSSVPGRLASRSRHSYLDDIVTYMHIALVTTTTQSKPAGSRWWHTAFQLAREFKLNREIRSGPSQGTSEVGAQPSEQQDVVAVSTSDDNASEDDEQSTDGGTSPMSVSEDAVVEPGHSKTGGASLQEREERRRIWWTLYLWDRQLALRFNSPLAIKDAESQDTELPLPDDQWQTLVFDEDPKSQNEQQQPPGSRHSRTGPPTTCTGTGLFDVLLPLMCILGQIIDLHHLSYHPRVERSSSNAVADAYINTITQQLNELEPSIQNMLSRYSAVYSVLDDMTSRRMQKHRQMLHCYARFLQHLLYALVGGQWDKLTLLEHADAFTTTPRFHMALNHSVAGADVLGELRSLDPDIGFKAMFFGIFTYHAATLPYVAVTHYKSKVNASVLAACQTYVHIFEATNCTHYSEYLRKMRKLLLFGIYEATTGIEITRSESHLRTHILKLYRWTGDGTGLGL